MFQSKNLLSTAILTCFFIQSFSQDIKKMEGAYIFSDIISLPATPVKNQANTGTCWNFATLSFLESELLRTGKGEYDLSEMYIVRNIYPVKAQKYVMRWGNQNFYKGGQAHDVFMVAEKYGLVPEKIYPGLKPGKQMHDHREMDALLKSFVETVVHKPGNEISLFWDEAFNAILDVYLGQNPGEFAFKGKSYTPISFYEELGIHSEDYIEFTSYSIYPFYEEVELDIPDNWSNSKYYNIPLYELIDVINNSLEKGYTIVWDGDISNYSFSSKMGIANQPLEPWNSNFEVSIYDYIKHVRDEINVDQSIRDEAFAKQDVVDNHLMHMIGKAEDQNGNVFYKIKDSLGKERNNFGGFIYMSQEYVKMNTVAIMVNKSTLSESLKNKLKLK